MTRKHIFILLVIAVVVSLVFLDADPSKSQAGPPAKLTDRETLGAVFLNDAGGFKYNMYKKANEDVKEDLYDVLENNQLADRHFNVIAMLGYIGNKKDADYLIKRFGSYKGALTRSQKTDVYMTFISLGQMGKRGIPGAENILKKMVEPKFWSKARFKWSDDPRTHSLPFEYELVVRALSGYALLPNVNLEEKITHLASLLEGEEEMIIKAFLLRASPKSINGNTRDMLKSEEESVSSETRSILIAMYQKNADNFKRKLVALSEEEIEFSTKMSKEALKEFLVFSSGILKKEHNNMLANKGFLDGGRVLETSRILKSKAEYFRDLERQETPLIMLENRIDPKAYSIKQSVKYSFDNIDNIKNGGVKAEIIDVTFVLNGSKNVVTKCFPRGNSSSSTFNADGELVVVMRRINGNWYWQPFGW